MQGGRLHCHVTIDKLAWLTNGQTGFFDLKKKKRKLRIEWQMLPIYVRIE
jgi:hypothetical protein